MANWLLIYSLGFVLAALAIALLAFQRRGSNDMQTRAVAQLAVPAGLVWPLLVVAGIQVAGLLILKTALGSVRSSVSSDPKSVEAPALKSVAPAPSVTAAVAA